MSIASTLSSLLGSNTVTVQNQQPLFIRLGYPTRRFGKDTSLINAIGSHETSSLQDKSGKYRAPTNDNERYSYQQPFSGAIGRYQVEPETLKTYGKRYFGNDVSPKDLQNSQIAQDKFIQERVKDLRSQGLSDEQIIKAWNVGLNGDFESPKAKQYFANVSKYLK